MWQVQRVDGYLLSRVDSVLDPVKLGPILIGPGGAFIALLLFIGYLLRELGTARKEKEAYLGKYETMREQRDEFRFLAGDAVRSAKRSTQTAVAIGSDRVKDME